MSILFIAPLPPPTHGQSYVSKVLLDDLQKEWSVRLINTSKANSKHLFGSIVRSFGVIRILFDVWKYRKMNQAIYITISESLGGNIKDLLTYLLLFKDLSRIIIHLHGGSIKKELWDKRPLLFKINKYFIKKFGAAIISGPSHNQVFIDIIDAEKIHVIPNFSPDHMFIEEKDLNLKFKNIDPIKVLYISGMRNKKGYIDLYNSFANLPVSIKNKVQIDFAGAFESEVEKSNFLNTIIDKNQIQYHGVVDESTKQRLYFQSHVFCLPTKYLEGQPISLLDAYASGCLVLTTGLGGIKDIFEDGTNGFVIQEGDSNSISSMIEFCILSQDKLKTIAFENRKLAFAKYKKHFYTSSLIKVFKTIIS